MSNKFPSIDIGRAMSEPRIEPEKRLVGGEFAYAVHRFPIKGGVSLLDVLVPNETPMLAQMLKRRR